MKSDSLALFASRRVIEKFCTFIHEQEIDERPNYEKCNDRTTDQHANHLKSTTDSGAASSKLIKI